MRLGSWGQMLTWPSLNKHQGRSVSLTERCEQVTQGPDTDMAPRMWTNHSLITVATWSPELLGREEPWTGTSTPAA